MEILDIYDDNGNLTGQTVERYSRELKKGEHVKASHIIIRNQDGLYLIQQRSATKKTRPNIWDLTCGAVSAGETSRYGATREVGEEVGLKITEDELEFIGQTLTPKGVFQDVFFLDKNFTLDDCTMQVEEVQNLKLITKEEMLKFMDTLTHRSSDYINLIKDYISRK